jgi:glycerophosphoryl diester phosphodiesterase
VKAWAGPEELLLTSFSRDLVLELAVLAPELPRGLITATEAPDYVRLAQATRSDAVIVRFPFASAQMADGAHAAGLPVFVWGCTDMAEVREALGMGIDGIISDWPDLAKREIERLAGG